MKRTMVVLAVVLFAGAASAENEKALAKDAYDRGTQAQERGDVRRAAEEFARADALAPNPVALQAALDSAVAADDPILGAELLERSKRARATGALAESVDAATKRLGGRAGHVHVACPSGARCVSTIDGASLDPTKGAWTKVGPHTLVVQVDGTPDTRTIEIRAGEDLELAPARVGAIAPLTPPSPAAPPSPAPGGSARTDPPSRKPLRPAVFWVGAGATIASAGVATALALSAKSKHDDFMSAGCNKAPASACDGLKGAGERVQRLANLGFAATAAAGIATVVVGAFFTDWAAAATAGRAPVLVPAAGGAALSYGSRF